MSTYIIILIGILISCLGCFGKSVKDKKYPPIICIFGGYLIGFGILILLYK